MNCEKAISLLATAKNVQLGKPIANNTRLFHRDDGIAIRLHATDIVLFHVNGDVVLNSGGYRTVTTKARINEYTDCCVSQRKGLWTVHYRGSSAGFADGMVLKANGTIAGGATWWKDEAATLKLRKVVNGYAKGFLTALLAGEVPVPSNGDCWCCAVPAFGGDKTHILSHIEEKYYVPSLLVNALKMGSSPMEGAVAYDLMTQKKSNYCHEWVLKGIEKRIKNHCYKALDLTV